MNKNKIGASGFGSSPHSKKPKYGYGDYFDLKK